MERRPFFRLSVALATAAALQRAGAQPAAAVTSLGVFSLLGDAVEVSVADAPTDTRVERTRRESYEFRNIGFDAIVGREVQDLGRRLLPGVGVAVFGATAPLSVADQRRIADGAEAGALPGWIIQTITQRQLSHVLLVTSARAPVGIRTADNELIGRGTVDGIGFHIDPLYEMRHLQTGAVSTGMIAAHAIVRLQLMDTQSATIVRSHTLNEQRPYGSREAQGAVDPWNYLTPTEKVTLLRETLERNLRRTLPLVLRGA